MQNESSITQTASDVSPANTSPNATSSGSCAAKVTLAQRVEEFSVAVASPSRDIDFLRKMAVSVGYRTLTPETLMAWWRRIEKKYKGKPFGLYDNLGITRHFLKWLWQMSYAPANFSYLLPKLSKPKKQVKYFTEDQYERLKEQCKGTSWYCVVILTYRTGMRLTDILKLKWPTIDLENCIITYTPANNPEPVAITFEAGSDLHQVLLDMREARNGDGHVCPMTYSFCAFYCRMRRAGITGLAFKHLREQRINQWPNSKT